MGTFVSVGNAKQPFSRMLSKTQKIAHRLPQPVVVQFGHNMFSCDRCRALPFLQMEEFLQLIESSDLVILHAGAGSIIHAVRAGKVPVVMPRRVGYGEHVDDHQLEFALELEKSGKLVIAMEPSDLEAAISTALLMQEKAHRRESNPPLVTLIRKCLDRYAQGRL